MANIDNVQLPDGSSYSIVDNTSGFATQNYVDSAVSSVTKTTIGLGNVDNTSDLNKPISTATQAALDALDEDKADKTDIATVESGTTASRAYSVGELVYVSGTLYRVKTAIASGATFTVGTNVEVTNVSGVLSKMSKFIYANTVTPTQLVPGITAQIQLDIPPALANKTIDAIIPIGASPQAHTTSCGVIAYYTNDTRTCVVTCIGTGDAQFFAIVALYIYH